MSFPVAVITISDRAAAGAYQDRSGPLAEELLHSAGFPNTSITVVPDEAAAIRDAIQAAHQAGARAIITTGGTGIGPRDITPEVTAELAVKEIPGIMEAIRLRGTANSPHAALSRGRAAVLEQTDAPSALIVNAPGSPGGVRDTIAYLTPLLPHIVGQLDGRDHS